MKKLFLFLWMAFVFVSCDGNQSKIDKSMKEYIHQNADDPTGYEPIETIVTDTFYTSDMINLLQKNDRSKIVEELKNNLKDNEIEYYHITHQARVKNKFGGMMMTKYYILADKNFDVLLIDENRNVIKYSKYEKFCEKYNIKEAP